MYEKLKGEFLQSVTESEKKTILIQQQQKEIGYLYNQLYDKQLYCQSTQTECPYNDDLVAEQEKEN